MRKPRSSYVRRKQARKPCLHCGSTNVVAMSWEAGPMFTCLDCLDAYWKSEGRPEMVGGVYAAYAKDGYA